MTEAVLKRPRIFDGSVFLKAKNFFAQKINRTKSFFRSINNNQNQRPFKRDDKTNAREVSINDTINFLTSIYDVETIVNIYKDRINKSNKDIEDITSQINNTNDKAIKKNLAKELEKIENNLKIDNYIYESTKSELKKQQELSSREEQRQESNGNVPQPEPPKQKPPKEEDNNPTESAEYTEIYQETYNLLQEKTMLSENRLKRTKTIINIISTINENTINLQGLSTQISQHNFSFQKNFLYEQSISKKTDENIKKLINIKPSFNILKEFGSLADQIKFPDYEELKECCYTILDKHYLLENLMNLSNEDQTKEIMKSLLKNLDDTLSNIKNNLSNPDYLSIMLTDVNNILLKKYYPNDNMKKQNLNNDDSKVEPPKEETSIVEQPKSEPVQEETAKVEQPKSEPQNEENSKVEQPNPESKKEEQATDEKTLAAEQKGRQLEELNVLYTKLNNINEVVSNPISIGYDALLYFEDIAKNTKLQINELKAKIKKSLDSSEEIVDKEFFPNSLDTFIKIYNENIVRATKELNELTIQYEEEPKEEILYRIETIKKYIDKVNSLILRRVIHEKRINKSINVLSVLSSINDDVTYNLNKLNNVNNSDKKSEEYKNESDKKTTIQEPKKESDTLEQQESREPQNIPNEKNPEQKVTPQKVKVKIRRIHLNKEQRINRINNILDSLAVYKVSILKKSIKIRYKQELLDELKSLQAELRIIVNSQTTPTITSSENKQGELVDRISNIDNLDSVKIVVESNGEVLREENIFEGERKL